MTAQIYLGLGTNLANRALNLRRAVHGLAAFVTVQAVSPVYQTPPWGVTDQPAFLNLCLSATSQLPPLELLREIKALERRLGRRETFRWGPRLIDIDILFYDDLILGEEGLRLPHPGLTERPFVLAPLADLAPDIVHPDNGRTVAELLASIEQTGLERLGRLDDLSWQPRAPFLWSDRTYVMGILNVTPDSFSGDGLLKREDRVAAAVAQAEQFAAEGADIIDIGGESSRPGSLPISAEQEMERILPVIQAVRRAVNVPISVDSYRAAVAAAALDNGADWLNDIWGLRMDRELAQLAAERGCPLILMHNRSQPKDVAQEERLGGRYVGVEYGDLIADIIAELQESIDLALNAGVQPEQIIIDPGIGFGKTVAQNLQLIRDLDQFKALGYPILLGSSRKSFIGYTLDLPPEERLEGTAATVSIGIDRGADIIRVHDVKAMSRVARMTDSLTRITQYALRTP
jgi:dihydropteroate synthase/2-amino-4-hydroxy-6-hydroxymethyldihydropteridine diphosphokinase